MPALPTLTAFAASPPPWSLASLDTNFTNISTLLKSANNYSLYLADAGAANAYAVSFAAGVTWTLAAGAEVLVNPANANTTASTLAVNSGTAKNLFVNGAALVGGEIKAGVPFKAVYDGTQFNIENIVRADTRQVFLSGSSATYTTPTGCRQLKVRMKGGGGGGAGSGTGSSGAGTVGNTTSFNSIVAAGGTNGAVSAFAGAAGGTGGSGTASVRIAGNPGQPGSYGYASATNVAFIGGGGGGQGGGVGQGGAAVVNTGGGGGAGNGPSLAFASASTTQAGGSGGEGEYVELVINSPAGTYTYTVAAIANGGGAGTSGNAGGAGGSGYIIVDEFY